MHEWKPTHELRYMCTMYRTYLQQKWTRWNTEAGHAVQETEWRDVPVVEKEDA